MSEIDDIFSSKTKSKASASQPVASTSSLPEKSTKKKDKKRKRNPEALPDDPQPKKSRPAPETIIDPSTLITTKLPKTSKKYKPPKTSSKSADHDENKFVDSRGSHSRKTTEEGWAIYKEDELGIHDGGGDTPLCPFDCECCF
ncbi:hypothetical protein H0H81_003774 [Sphagnurus paluster]|uniref:DUF1764-domain-containing protein n=1 Tax=Sphagnurus paluster TaxID=117069 RepID=A0A9P7KPS7_9AGAR|nr:hypothetical protein H0H81_003774 [Sphagnurus paluster]